MNIANKLTLFRIFLVPIFIMSLLILGIDNILGFLIFIISSITDMLAWMVCIVLAREFIISGFRLIAATNGIVISASIYGKIKTITQLFAISFILLNSTNFIKIPMNIDRILWYISVVFTVMSAIDYIWKNLKVLDLKNI